MTQTVDQLPAHPSSESDLGSAVHQVLAASESPLTPTKIRSKLPAPFRDVSPEELADYLHRQVAAGALHAFPKYRGSQPRFWDRSMPVHIGNLLRQALQDGPFSWSVVRRRLPSYVLPQAEAVLAEQVAQGLVHRHPRGRGNRSERFGLQSADPKDYLKYQLPELFQSMEGLGFNRTRVREALLDLLHSEEWSP
jgi:hypothetical protein